MISLCGDRGWWLLLTQLSAERRVPHPGTGQDSGEEQKEDQRQQDGQQQHCPCQDSRQGKGMAPKDKGEELLPEVRQPAPSFAALSLGLWTKG